MGTVFWLMTNFFPKLCGTANLSPSHRPYTRISWVCSVTQAMLHILSPILSKMMFIIIIIIILSIKLIQKITLEHNYQNLLVTVEKQIRTMNH